MGEDLNKTAAPWKIIADMWNTWFTPPSRVSKDEASKYKELLEKYKAKTALVLGVTPEIREALAELNYKTTCIDINPEMIKAMDSVLTVKNPNEQVINENWLDNTLKDKSFDIVLGDAVFPNVPWAQRTNLLNQVIRVLKPGGLFITRAFCMPKQKRFKDINELMEHFSEKEPNYQAALEFVLELQILAYNSEDHEGTFSKPKQMLEKIRSTDGFTVENENIKKILDMVWEFWCVKFVDKVYLYDYRENEEEFYKQSFDIIETYEAEDTDYGSITPMYVLKLVS